MTKTTTQNPQGSQNPAVLQPQRLAFTPHSIGRDTRDECANPRVFKLRQLRERTDTTPTSELTGAFCRLFLARRFAPPTVWGKDFLSCIP